MFSYIFVSFRILSDTFLTAAAFFDPRFQNQLNANERDSVRTELGKYFDDTPSGIDLDDGISDTSQPQSKKKNGKRSKFEV